MESTVRKIGCNVQYWRRGDLGHQPATPSEGDVDAARRVAQVYEWCGRDGTCCGYGGQSVAMVPTRRTRGRYNGPSGRLWAHVAVWIGLVAVLTGSCGTVPVAGSHAPRIYGEIGTVTSAHAEHLRQGHDEIVMAIEAVCSSDVFGLLQVDMNRVCPFWDTGLLRCEHPGCSVETCPIEKVPKYVA